VLAAAIREDRARGLRPAIAVASAGTINTGAVDDLEALGAVCREEGLWFHVDGAYGGFFRMTERGRARLRGIERADSITVDPHKGLFLPYGTGCLLVRNGADLSAPHRGHGAYLPKMQEGSEAQDFSEYSPELSRPFRGLRVWLAFRIFGARAFREALDEKLDLALLAARGLAGIPGIEVVAEPELSITAFRVAARDAAEGDRRTRELLESVNARRRVFLSGTVFRGRFVIRICVLSFRTHRERVEEAIDIVRREAARV
jgi:aromatic-L-amino-acid decarboxylase